MIIKKICTEDSQKKKWCSNNKQKDICLFIFVGVMIMFTFCCCIFSLTVLIRLVNRRLLFLSYNINTILIQYQYNINQMSDENKININLVIIS